MRGCWVLLWVLPLTLVHHISAYRVLFLGPISSKSHKNFYMGIVGALAENGHQVTMVSPYPPSKVITNVQEVVVPAGRIDTKSKNTFAGQMTQPMATALGSITMCSDSLESENVQALLKEEFDVALLSMMLSDCYHSLVYQLKVPVVHVAPLGLTGPMMPMNPTFPSFMPITLTHFQHPMSFKERLMNTVFDTALTASMLLLTSLMDKECRSRGLCLDDMPSLNQLRLNSSLLLLNSVQTLEKPSRPYMPGVINVGGIHCKPPKPLPQDLNEWVEENGDDGFIFFSLGSIVKSQDLPEKYRQVLMKAFASLKQRVLFKWNDDTMPDKPKNVRLGKWLPQQDILGHPKLRLFITHGGLHSVLESTYHGVPVLGMPVFADQHLNLLEAQREGWGKLMLWQDLNEKDLRESIINLTEESSFHDAVQKRSLLMRDQPLSPTLQAVYWVEYTVRHNGATHLRSPVVDMSWYQLYNVDVWATVFLIILLVIYILYRLFRLTYKLLLFVVRKVFSSKDKPKSD